MFQFIPVQEDNIVAVRATGKLSHEDYEQFLPQIEHQLRRYGKISLLIELDDFVGWELDAAKDDYQFGIKHRSDFEKIALVGEKSWERWMALLAKPFIHGKIRYFSRDELQIAWDWLREESAADESAHPLTPYQRILAAVDFSPHAIQAARRAQELAERYDAQLLLLNVINNDYLYDAAYGSADPMMGFAAVPQYSPGQIQKHEQALRNTAEAHMRQLIEETAAKNAQTRFTFGHADSAIISCAEAMNADLIVVGTHGRRGLARLLGSTARSVQGHARCDVLTVPLNL